MSSETLTDLRAPISAIVVCEGAGGVGALVTGPAVRTWYPGLRKPAFNPPSWIFAPVWTLLYLLMGVSLFLTWRRRPLEARAAPALLSGVSASSGAASMW